MSVLHFENISMRFAGPVHVAVDGFTGHVAQGEIVALVSARAQAKARLREQGGAGIANGRAGLLKDANSERQPTLRDVQMVFQDPFASHNPVHRSERLKRPLVR